jgi:hypothetical protein
VEFALKSLPASTIFYSYLQFSSKSPNAEPVKARIFVENSASPDPLGNGRQSISQRLKSNSYIDWNIQPWSTNEEAIPQQTVDVSYLVQSMVNQEGWTDTSTVVFIIERAPSDQTSNLRDASPAVELRTLYLQATPSQTPSPTTSPSGTPAAATAATASRTTTVTPTRTRTRTAAASASQSVGVAQSATSSVTRTMSMTASMTPTTSVTPTATMPASDSASGLGAGAIVGILLVIVFTILVAGYFFTKRKIGGGTSLEMQPRGKRARTHTRSDDYEEE